MALYEMTDLPTDSLLNILSFSTRRDILAMLRTSHILNAGTNTRHFWLTTIHNHCENDYEREWVTTLSTPALERLLIKWNSDANLSYSPGSENFVTPLKLAYEAYKAGDRPMIGYLSKLYYDPVAYCEHLADAGDRKCIEIAEDNKLLYAGCIYSSLTHSIMKGHDALFMELLGSG